MASKIIVEGFKSIGDRVEVEVRPLTLLAGANSSGKSSLMQAILLLKQTIEATFDPGPLLLNGPNVKFTSFDQLLHVGTNLNRRDRFAVGLFYGDGDGFETLFRRVQATKRVQVERCQVSANGKSQTLNPKMNLDVIQESIDKAFRDVPSRFVAEVSRHHFTLMLSARTPADPTLFFPWLQADLSPLDQIIHIPGLRGNPERSYPLTATGPTFPGTFERYTASLVSEWASKSREKLRLLGKNLKRLGLTWIVEAKMGDEASVELRVGRLPRAAKNRRSDLVNIADVGFGVSQALPVLVALLEAKPDQFVFIEQPEIHLHPRAQVAMAGLLADAAKRGVQLVIETHSPLLLMAVQTLVAQGDLDSNLVKLHWFTRDEESGSTRITSGGLDEAGRFGDWPEDFDDVSLRAESEYLDAVESVILKE